MAGPIRQPIDLDSLSHYLEQNIPEIKLPISIKQVNPLPQALPPSHSTD